MSTGETKPEAPMLSLCQAIAQRVEKKYQRMVREEIRGAIIDTLKGHLDAPELQLVDQILTEFVDAT